MTEIAGRGTDEISRSNGITYFANGLGFGDVGWTDWENVGKEMTRVIGVFNNHIKWWLGDWIIFGENHFPAKYSQALDETMYSIGTLRNAVYVCRNIPIENRNPGLTFEHHYEVAKLPVGDQGEWLAQADANNWTCRQLRRAIKGEDVSGRALPDRMPPIGEEKVERLTFDEWWTSVGSNMFVAMLSNPKIGPANLAEFVWKEARK